MTKFDRFLNSVSDSNRIFAPIPFVRLKKNERLNDLRILLHTPGFAMLVTFFPVLTYLLMTDTFMPAPWLLTTFGVSLLGVFFGFRQTFVRSWNRRADHLNKTARAGLLNITAFHTAGGGGPGPRNTPIPFKRGPSNETA